ncbi:MAG: hypothetical protein FJ025_05660 [Chloroflexi bacterium]|nr:hypothetical protein [Chloroflexota bacterium]
MANLENSLARTEADAEATLKAATNVVSSIKKFRDAAKQGNLRDLRRVMDAAEQAIAALRQQFANAKEGWDFDDETYISSRVFHLELIEAARQAGVKIFDQFGMIYCHPYLIRVKPQERTILIDKIIERRLRPSILAKRLKELQNRPVRFKPSAFLDCLFMAYSKILLNQKIDGKVVKLFDIYDLLTLLPGQAKEYTKAEFARDIYLVDKSGVSATNQGFVLNLVPPGRDIKRSLKVITEEGQERLYYGISFKRP